MVENTTRLYGVSSGDGNSGVSHMFADYYVRTNDPFLLATVAQISTFKKGAGQEWCARNVEVDGEADYTVYAVLYNPPCEDTPDGEYPESDNPEDEEDGRNWSDANGAWSIVEVFPADEDETRERNVYDTLEDAFSAADILLARSV